VQALVIDLPRGQSTVSLTLSAGIATFPHDGQSAAELLDQADSRLFRAKGLGRNKVVGGVSQQAATALHRAG